MIERDELNAGSYYYFLLYEDSKLTVPLIETLRFKGISKNGAGDQLYVFDRVVNGKPSQSRLTEDLLGTLFEFDTLVSELEANREAQRRGVLYQPVYPKNR